MQNSRTAFTLMELAIVLTIIGLLIGGVIVGRDMIRSSEINSLANDKNRFVQATQNFREKYSALPGDMRNATSYWGIAGGTTGNDTTCRDTVSVDIKTCNGDGDGRVEQLSSTNSSYEMLRYWQQMSNAGMIEGQFTGKTGSPTYSISGTTANLPASRIGGVGWILIYAGQVTGGLSQFAANYGHVMYPVFAINQGLILTPNEAYSIDTKVDDGAPGTGMLISDKGTVAAPCTTKFNTAVGSDGGALYNVTDKNKDCTPYFIQAF